MGQTGFQSTTVQQQMDIFDKLIKGNVDDLTARLDLLEANVAALPGIVAESIIAAFDAVRYGEVLLEVTVIDDSNEPLKNQYGTNAKPPVRVDGQAVVDVLTGELERVLKEKLNFDELNQLRARVCELEEDMGYRRKVAERLMEEPQGNGRK